MTVNCKDVRLCMSAHISLFRYLKFKLKKITILAITYVVTNSKNIIL